MRSSSPLRRWSLTLAALGSLAACSGSGRSTPSPFDMPRGGTTTSLELLVDNQNFNNVRLEAESIRGREPIGRVSGNGRATFRLQWSGMQELRIRMDFLASGEYVSNSLTVRPGDRIELMIAPDPRNTILRRRP